MKVAIIGAGVAGLSCAYELEKYGIIPTIYERNGFIGEQYEHVTSVLDIFHRPIKDSRRYIKKKYDISLTPLNTINNLVHFSPNKTTTIKGDFGHFYLRGRESDSIKNQLYSHLKKTNIIFNKLADYRELAQRYDYVVIANGISNYTEELGCWQSWVNTYIKGAVVTGNFDPNSLLMWINKEYCKNGYAYLTPFNSKRASIILVVTDIVEKQIDEFWELFFSTENFDYNIISEYKQEHKTGFVYPLKLNNIYITGNAAGGIDPFLGFGQTNALFYGIFAAISIAQGKNYQKLQSKLQKNNLNLHEFRKAFNQLCNKDYDLIVSTIGLPGIKHAFYYTNLNVVKTGGFLLGLKNKMTSKGKCKNN